jgi:phage-related protein (TIGR01555 family)
MQRLLAAAMQSETPMPGHPVRPERPPDGLPILPPGVVPPASAVMATDALPGEVKRQGVTMDSACGGVTPAWGFGAASGYGNGFWFPGYPYLAELTQISEYRAPCETISTEMTRKWFEIQSKNGGDKTDKIAKIMARLDELKVRELFRRAALLDAEFGRAQIYMNVDDADDRTRQLPLEITPEGIKKGSLKSLSCIEPYWSTPYSWNAAYPERDDFYKPTSWYIMGRKTHATRLLTFIAREVPAYNFSGISLIQLGEMTVNMWLRTRKAVNDLINNFSIPVLSTDLSATLEEGGPEGGGLFARVQAFTLMRNNQSVAVVNNGTEELKFAEATLASLDKLQAQSQEHMAAVWHTPLVKIFGLTPTGLGATAEGEIQVWYDWVNASQIQFFQPHLETMLKAVQCDLFGAIDDDLVIHWVTLDEPTQKELSEIRKSDCEMDASNIQAGIISPDEARARLQSDPDSGYTNLTGPAPEPEQTMVDEDGNPVDPDAPPSEGDDEGDDETPEVDPSDEAQKNRDHEAEQNDLDRKHELKLAAAKKPPAIPIKAKTKG